MDLRRGLLANSWIQLLLVLGIVISANTWAARSFTRLDMTTEHLYSLDLASRGLMYKLEKPLKAKVYFTGGLQAPYNNVEQIVTDKLEDLRAYSHGWMEIESADPTNQPDREAEAQRFGIQPIQYRYRDSNVAEMRKVFMGVALIYGDKQEVLPAITQVETLEYDLARAVKRLVSDEEPRIIGFSSGSGEPDFMSAGGPVEVLRTRLAEKFRITAVPLGGDGLIPDELDALLVVGPQRPVSARAQYQMDQFLMRGGALAVFVTNTKPDMRTLRPQGVYHGLEPLLGNYGIQVNRDVVVDRARNGVMRFPVRQGNYMVQMPVNYPLIPRATDLAKDSVITKGLDSMLFPFASSIDLADPFPNEADVTVIARSSEASGKIKGIRTIDPNAYKIVDPAEQRGSFPLLVTLNGTFRSAFADKEIPAASPESGIPDMGGPRDDAAGRLRESAPTRLVVSGSADFVANNVPFLLNLVDWMVQDESLIAIRSKSVQVPPLEPLDVATTRLVKAVNLLFGPLVMLLIALARQLMLRRSGFSTDGPSAEGEAA